MKTEDVLFWIAVTSLVAAFLVVGYLETPH